MKRITVISMSGLVVAIGIVLMAALFGGMKQSPNAEWDIVAIAATGAGLLGVAVTIIWRALSAEISVWEATVQYALSGGLLAAAAIRHGFYVESVSFSQTHLVVSVIFCFWNLISIYRVKAGLRKE